MKKIAATLALVLAFCGNIYSQSIIGYTDIAVIYTKMPLYKTMESEINLKRLQNENEIRRRYSELESKEFNFQRDMQIGLSDILREDREREMAMIKSHIKELRSNIEEELLRVKRQYSSSAFKEIRLAIEAVGKENGYLYILKNQVDEEGNPSIFYAGNTSLDVTNLVLIKLGVTP